MPGGLAGTESPAAAGILTRAYWLSASPRTRAMAALKQKLAWASTASRARTASRPMSSCSRSSSESCFSSFTSDGMGGAVPAAGSSFLSRSSRF